MNGLDGKTAPGLKLEQVQKCLKCGGSPADAGPMFYRLTVDSAVFDRQSQQRLAGLHLMMGQNASLTRAFWDDSDVAKVIETKTFCICLSCFVGEDGIDLPMLLAKL